MATGTGNLPYPMSPVSPFDVITSQAENERIANIESLADGTGIGDKAITAPKIDFTTFNFGNYSTSEADTGVKWINNKTIYKRTFTGVSVTPGNVTNVPHGISIDTPIQCFGSTAAGTSIPLFAAATNYISVRVDKTNVTVFVGSSVSSTTASLTIFYTKV